MIWPEVSIFFPFKELEFGDLFFITGKEHPSFQRKNKVDLSLLQPLGFKQQDDSFSVFEDGMPAITLLPVIRRKPVFSHPGPYDGVLLEYNFLTSSKEMEPVFLEAVSHLSELCSDNITFDDKSFMPESGQEGLLKKMKEISDYWSRQDVEKGSFEAIDLFDSL